MGVNRIVDGPGPGAGGFAILKPLPAEMWGTQTIKLSLRRIQVPSEDSVAALLEKEQAKLPAKLVITTKHMNRRRHIFDAGHRLSGYNMEVSFCVACQCRVCMHC